jgi:hypothetical protein
MLDSFSKNPQISKLMKIRPVEAELFHADRRTDGQDLTKLIVAFCNFSNASKKGKVHLSTGREGPNRDVEV